jgi:hypothetical protein
MNRFAQFFVLACVTCGIISVGAGAALGAVSLGLAWLILSAFGCALLVLWDHARDA